MSAARKIHTHSRTRLLLATGAIALVVAGCAAPGAEDGGAPSAEAGGGAGGTDDVCTGSEAVRLAEEVKDLSPEERETKLLEAATEARGGEIDLYTEINDPTIITDPFEERYGDLTLNVYRAGSEQIRQRVLEESAAQFSGSDLIEMDTLEMAILDTEGLLAPATSPMASELTEAAQFDNYTGDRLSYIVPVWNTDQMSAEDAPQSLEDFADPRFKGKLALEGSDVFWFAGMVMNLEEQGKSREEAVDLFRSIAENAAITSGHTTTTELVVAGQYAIAMNNYVHRALEMQAKGAPLAFAPVKIPVVAEITATSVSCLSDNPAGAMLLQDFILSEDGGQPIFVEDGRTPADASLAQDTLGGETIEPIKVDVADVAANYAEWASLWDEVIQGGSQG